MDNKTQSSSSTTTTSVFARSYQRVRKLFNLKNSASATESIKSLSDLCLAQAARRERHYRDNALPEALLKAFAVEPLTSDDARFVGREEPLQRLSVVIERWRAGRSSMLAVTGPQGCGLSSFLRQIERDCSSSDEFCYHQLTNRPYDTDNSLQMLTEIIGCKQPVKTIEELLEYLRQLPPKVFVIDNGHLLSSRVMSAHAAIRVFGAVMVASQQRHLWVLGCEEFAWRRLTYIHRAEHYFNDLIELGMLSAAELNQCIAIRQQVSGVTLDSTPTSGDSDLPDVLEKAFVTLYKLSSGKPDLAFFYYLRSLQLNRESQRMEQLSLEALDFNALKSLLSEELFTLAEIAVHGRMTIDEHRTLFRSSHEESWLLLEHLYQQCLLDRIEDSDDLTYRLMPLYSEIISHHLTNANYLY
ncbi:MAG: ATP-binding protein [Methyloprofundus sp.]|nr:ATP-binding protein [Methyloprofundus sp.]MDT8424552.1 ATP-binding protein [Methyloprofundus sp.]